jgi:hypothetical protein
VVAATDIAHAAKHQPAVERACVIAFRTFDACDAVSLHEAEQLLLNARVARNSIEFRASLQDEIDTLRQPSVPLSVDLGSREIGSGKHAQVFGISARVFDYGTISVSFELGVHGTTTLSDLAEIAAELEDSRALSAIAREEYDQITAKIGQTLRGRHEIGEVHKYAVVLVERLAPGTGVPDLLAWPGLPKLVTCERDARAVSAQEKEDVLKYTDAYLEDDVVVIGASCALVVEPGGSRDVPDVLELVRAQVTQLLHYDDVLDKELESAYRDFDRGLLGLAFHSHFSTTLRRLSRRRLELTEFTERIDSALKIRSDAYLARVYRKTLERFAVPALKNRVSHKHRLLLDIYTTLKDEVALLRSFTVEVLIVILIVVEVVLGLASH